jgi:chromosomal replication initiator protein
MSVNSFPFDRYLSIDKQNLPPEIVSKINKNNNFKEIALKESKALTEAQDENIRFHQAIKTLVKPMRYEELFKDGLVLKTRDKDSALLECRDENHKITLITQYFDEINEALEITFGVKLLAQLTPRVESNRPVEIKKSSENKYTLDLETTQEEKAIKADSIYLEHVNEQGSELMIHPDKTFTSFVVGPSNNMAFSAAKAVAEKPGNRGSYPTLYIYSGSGLGKTHLLHAVANEVKERYPELIICLISAKEFINEMIQSVQSNSMSDFMRRYTDRVDLLMIDDIHEIRNKETTQDLIFDIFNMLHKKGKQLIFTSDMDPSKIDGISERLKTRLGWGLVIDIQKPDLETRIAILKRKAGEIDLYLTDDILNLIANSVRSSIRELEGALLKLHAYYSLMGIDLDYELVKRYLGLDNIEEIKEVTLDTVAKATSQYFRITVADLKSRTRKKDVAHARHVAMFLSRKIVNSTLDEVGKFYGGRDHTTVLSAEKNIFERIKVEGALAKDILYIENNL